MVWFQTEDGHKGRNRPKRIPRPGVEDETESNVETYGKGALPIEDFEAWLKGDFVELDPDTYQPKEPLALDPPAGELTREQRNARILDGLAAGRSRRDLAEEWHLSTSTIGRIARSGRA